jgi:hypothetical protein
VDDELITRGEIEGLLFNVADIAAALRDLDEFLGGDDGEEGDEG